MDIGDIKGGVWCHGASVSNDFYRDLHQWSLLSSITHYVITVGNATDIHCNITMQYDIAIYVHTMTSQWIMMLLWGSFIMYCYVQIWYCCFHSELFQIVHKL